MSASADLEPQSTRSSSRRALLGAGLGALAAAAASALTNPFRAEATHAGYLQIHHVDQPATGITGLRNSNTGNFLPLFQAVNTGAGQAVAAISTSGTAVEGSSTSSIGVHGFSSSGIGVQGISNASDLPAVLAQSSGNSTGLMALSGGSAPAAKAKTGIFGQATHDSTSRGVWGRSTAGRGVFGEASSGIGVRGFATSGVGLSGEASAGYALRTTGRVRFDEVSGVATIAAGTTSVTVTPGVNVTADSFVLLTPKANLGGRDLWFTTDAANDRFTIRISSSRPSGTQIAWLQLG